MKRSGSSARGARAKKSGELILNCDLDDSEIDFSDIPPATTEELEAARLDRRKRLAGRPPSGKPWRMMISIRLEPELLEGIRNLAKKADQPYQTWIHETLERAVKRKRRA